MQIQSTTSFERELRKLARKHYPITVLTPCLAAIIKQDGPILRKIKDHALRGKWKGYREFHPARYGNYSRGFDDWIVVYCLADQRLKLILVTTGNHKILH